MKRKHPVNSYDDLMQRVKALRIKFEKSTGKSLKPTKEDLSFIKEKLNTVK